MMLSHGFCHDRHLPGLRRAHRSRCWTSRADIVSPENACHRGEGRLHRTSNNVIFRYSQPTRRTRCWIMSTCTFRSGADRGHPGRHRLLQIQPGAADPPPVRRQRGQRARGRRATCAITTWKRCATQVAVVLQKNVLFSGTIKDNLRWGNENATDEEMRPCLPSWRSADELHPELPRQVRHLHRAGRHQRLRRPEAAPLHRPRAAEKAQDADPGRLHQRRGHRAPTRMIRKALREEHARHDQDHHCPARGQRDGRRPDRGAGSGPGSGVGTHDELLKTSDIYREVYESQMKGSDAK